MNYFCLLLTLFLAGYLCSRLTGYKLVKSLSLTIIIVILIAIPLHKEDRNELDYGWHVKYMEYIKMHQYSTGKTQKIALIDSGISDFQTKKNNNLNFTNLDNGYDKVGHGTMMYSLIKGYKNEILGIAPEVELISLKVVDSEGSIKPSVMVDAIQESINLNCTIINLSLGSYKYNQDVSNMIDKATKQGITVVAASGDYSTHDMMFPANKQGVISVGSLSKGGSISSFTNSPSNTTLNVPGEQIKSVNQSGNIEYTSGTSQSTALLSGFIALLKDYAFQKGAELSNDRIIDLLSSNNQQYSTMFSKVVNTK